MTFRTRLLLDRLLAVPLSVACNAFVRLLGHLLKRDHSVSPETTRQIVVCKFVGMGSIIQATPLLRALKARFPGSRLTFVTLESNRALVNRLEGVDDAICLNDRGVWSMAWTTARALQQLIGRRVDHYFDLEIYSGFACLFSVFSLARNRFGFYRHSNRFKKGIYTHLVYFNTRMPVRRIYLQLGQVAGLPPGASDRLGLIRIEDTERQNMRSKLAELGLPRGERYLLVNPNASDLLIERRWPESHVVGAMKHLAESALNVVLMGAPSEAEFVRGLCSQVPVSARSRLFNTAGLLTLGEALALIEGAACVLTNDTGPMHMAFALERPTVCLFGPADPVHYGIDRPGVVMLYAPVACSPCIYEVDEPPCHGNNICMQRLSPAWVVEHVLAHLAQDTKDKAEVAPVRPSIPTRLPLAWENGEGEPVGTLLRCPANPSSK